MTQPTKRQSEYLEFIRAFTDRWGTPPSFEEIGRHFRTTPPSVNSMVKTLEARGFLTRVPGATRSLRVLVPPAGASTAVREPPVAAVEDAVRLASPCATWWTCTSPTRCSSGSSSTISQTHRPGALYKRFPPEEARRILRKIEFHYTPKHGSWLNMAEIEIGILNRQCLDRRIPNTTTLVDEVAAWEHDRNAVGETIDWMFDLDTARKKLARAYTAATTPARTEPSETVAA